MENNYKETSAINNKSFEFTNRQKKLMKWLNDEVFRRNVHYSSSYLRKMERELFGFIE